MIDPAHLTDAELAAWYGSGLHAPKAQRLIEEVRRLRGRLVGEIELRCTFQAESERGEEMVDRLLARLAEVEAERDAAIAGSREIRGTLLEAQARLAAVEAPLAEAREWAKADAHQDLIEALDRALAAARGEADRPAVAEQMLADVKREHAAAWAAANRPNLGPVECKHSPEWHAGLAWCNNCQPRCAANGCTNRATSTRKSAVPGWPDELACGQHGREGDRPIPERFLRGEGER